MQPFLKGRNENISTIAKPHAQKASPWDPICTPAVVILGCCLWTKYVIYKGKEPQCGLSPTLLGHRHTGRCTVTSIEFWPLITSAEKLLFNLLLIPKWKSSVGATLCPLVLFLVFRLLRSLIISGTVQTIQRMEIVKSYFRVTCIGVF